MLAADKPVAAVSALNVALKDSSANRELFYWRALAILDIGDTSRAVRDLIAAGLRPARLASLGGCFALLGGGGGGGPQLCPPPLAGSVCLVMNERQHEGVIEAYAFRV